MGCTNVPNDRDEQLLEQARRGDFSQPDPEIIKEWKELQSDESRQKMIEKIDKMSEDIKESGEKPSIPPENLEDWANYLDNTNKDLQLSRRDILQRLKAVPAIRDFGKSGIISDKDIKHNLVSNFPNKILSSLQPIDFSNRLVAFKDENTGEIIDAIQGQTDYRAGKCGPITINQQYILEEELKGLKPVKRIMRIEEEHYLTLNHEAGHHIWEELPEDLKKGWSLFYQTTEQMDYKFITNYAIQDAEEDFCECLSFYKEKPKQLFFTDVRKFRFFNELKKEGII